MHPGHGFRLFVFGALGLASLAVGACKVRDDGNNGLATAGQLPQLVGGAGDASSATKVGTFGQGGGTRLVLDLTRVPDGSSPNLWRCWSVPPSDFSLGQAVCQADHTNVVPLTAANVDVVCSNDPNLQTVATATPLALGTCAAYDIYSFQFDPPLTMSVGF